MIIVIIKHDFSITVLRSIDVHKYSERGHKEPISNTHTHTQNKYHKSSTTSANWWVPQNATTQM